jgi:HEAT repeat protein
VVGAAPAPATGLESVQVAAVVALGRIASDRAVPALVPLTRASSPELRAAVVWALSRLPGPAAAEALARAAGDPRPDVAALAWLGLGPHRRLTSEETLRVLRDPSSPLVLRRAAAIGGARAGLEGLGGPLGELLSDREPSLASCAGAGLRLLRLERSAPVWRQALLGEAPGRTRAVRLLRAPADAPLPDDGRAVGGSLGEVEAGRILDELCAPPPAPGGPGTGAALEPPWQEQPGLVADILARALADGGESAGRALEALERLLPPAAGAAARPASAARAGAEPVQTLSSRLRGPLATRLDDPELRVRLAAARVAARLGSPAVEIRHLLDALATTAPGRRAEAGTVDPEETAVLLAGALQVSGHLHGAGADRLRALLADPAWQTRRAAARALIATDGLAEELERRIAGDPSPQVRELRRSRASPASQPPMSR